MKYFNYLISAFIYCWLFSGVGFADDPAGSDGQLQYNDNGSLAGAELYYSNQTQKLDILGSLKVDDNLYIGSNDFSISSAAPPNYSAGISYSTGPGSIALILFEQTRLILFSSYVSIGEKLAVGGGVPQATLDINGYAKLKPYSSQPVSCTSSMRGTIVMNGNYDLCVCRPTFNHPGFRSPDLRTPNSRRPDSRGPGFFPTSSFRLVRDPGKKCW